MSRAHSLVLVCAGLVGTASAQSPLEVTGLPGDAPLRVSASATPEVLSVDLELQPEWHVYSRDVGGGQPVALSVVDGSGFTATGPLRFPADDGGKLRGDVHLELPIERKGNAGALRAVLDFMVCDPLQCLPPMSVEITGTVGAGAPAGFSVLLVVDQADERSARIEELLTSRGLTVTVVTYDDVTTETCDAHAVVLADSKLFREGKRIRQQVHGFPKTVSPIVAVGFWGTELVEAHGLAMTSGYI